METLLNIIRGLVAFIAASGFLFGQLYFGTFSWAASATGLFGLLAAILGGKFGTSSLKKAYIVILSGAASTIGILFSAYNYYAHLDIPGNSFGWELKAPYIAFLIFIGWYAIQHHLTSSSSGTDNP